MIHRTNSMSVESLFYHLSNKQRLFVTEFFFLYLHGSRYLANCYAGFTLEFIHYKVCCNVKSGNVVGLYTGR